MKTLLLAMWMLLAHVSPAVAATSSDASVGISSAKVTVNGMVCAFCAQGIEIRLQKLPATQSVWVDLKKKVVLVQAKPKQTIDQKAVTEEIVNAGYDVVKFELLAQSVAELKSTMQAQP